MSLSINFFPAMRIWRRRGKELFSAPSTKSFAAGIISGLKAWSWGLHFRTCRAQGPQLYAQPKKLRPPTQYVRMEEAQPIRPLSEYRVCMMRRPHIFRFTTVSRISILFDKITNRISFARIKNASDQFRVENRPYLKLNFILGLFSN